MRGIFHTIVLGFGAALLLASGGAHAVTFSVLHSFGGLEGGYPLSDLHRGSGGILYGTTNYGSRSYGSVFKLAPDMTFTVLYSFSDQSIGYPSGGVREDTAGNLYGSTWGGPDNYGTVYKLAPDGTETTLHEFSGSDGFRPVADLLGLVGVTHGGGAYGGGVVYKIKKNGQAVVLHEFGNGTDGYEPNAGLVKDGAGNLYGTTELGGPNGHGTVFRLATDGTETLLYSFAGADGATPMGSLLLDGAGNLYGTTAAGGANNNGGTVFELAPDGTETVLYSFGSSGDGSGPAAGLIASTDGTVLYGTTEFGGTHGYGTVFALENGAETILHHFTGGKDGAYPEELLTKYAKGNIVGTASGGGTGGTGWDGWGVIFEVSTK